MSATRRVFRHAAVAAAALLPLAVAALARPAVTPPSERRSAAEAALIPRLEAFIEEQVEDKKLPALSVALVDGDRVVWARGFGFADLERKTPVSPQTVYRVGSVSKLFTDIAIMQLVERGELALDVPIQRILPDFRPKNPFRRPVTLSQLMSHQAGLVREPPVGHYFDPSEPSLAATVASLNDTELVYSPGTHTKYSNAGIAVVGYALERHAKKPFATYLKQAVLGPMGMSASAFEPEPWIRERLARAVMWGYDGRTFPAPTFELGMSPAGSLYSTVDDMARFLRVLFRGGAGERGPVLARQTLERMWTPRTGEQTGYGIGFRVSRLDGHRAVGHDGAIYGFATSLLALPDDKLGAVAVTTRDAANAVTGRIVREALRLLIAARQGKPLPPIEPTESIDPERARTLAGRYAGRGEILDLVEQNGELSTLAGSGGYRNRLRRVREALVYDGPLRFGERLAVLPNALRVGLKTLERVSLPKPDAPPAGWKELVGEYGWDHDILYVLERDRRLNALIEWFEYDPLTEVATDVWRFPDSGLYDHETLAFVRDGEGRVTGVKVGPVLFPRRAIGPEEGKTFRITPVRPVDALRREALEAAAPRQPTDLLAPDLVELVALDPTIRLDVRYATPNNFLGTAFYTQARAFLQRPAAEALGRVHRTLEASGYGLLVHDAYRPWAVTKMFWDATPEDKHIFVADPATGSRHNRGCAVDLTLYDRRTGEAAVMTGGYDEMSDRSFAFYPGGTSLARWQRDLLRRAMEAEGFAVYEWEWWHFDYKDWERYPVMNVPFQKMGNR